MLKERQEEKGSKGDAPQARGSTLWGDFTRGRGPPLNRLPIGGGGENQGAVGVSSTAGGIGNGKQEELRAKPPGPCGSGFCSRCTCGALCRWG